AVRETSNWLGNTPAMSRRSYIHPAVIEAYERGDVVRHALERPEVLIASGRAGLDRSEWELLLLLRRARPERARPAVPEVPAAAGDRRLSGLYGASTTRAVRRSPPKSTTAK